MTSYRSLSCDSVYKSSVKVTLIKVKAVFMSTEKACVGVEVWLLSFFISELLGDE